MVKIPDMPKQPERKIEQNLYEPGKFEITEKEEFVVEISVRLEEERWVVVNDKQLADEVHEVTFRMWNYEEEVDLRKQATNFDPIKRMHLIDNDMLNRLKLQKLIKSWSFEKDNPNLKLIHVNGILCDESYKAIMSLHPNILRFIIEKMNDILEYNA